MALSYWVWNFFPLFGLLADVWIRRCNAIMIGKYCVSNLRLYYELMIRGASGNLQRGESGLELLRGTLPTTAKLVTIPKARNQR